MHCVVLGRYLLGTKKQAHLSTQQTPFQCAHRLTASRQLQPADISAGSCCHGSQTHLHRTVRTGVDADMQGWWWDLQHASRLHRASRCNAHRAPHEIPTAKKSRGLHSRQFFFTCGIAPSLVAATPGQEQQRGGEAQQAAPPAAGSRGPRLLERALRLSRCRLLMSWCS